MIDPAAVVDNLPLLGVMVGLVMVGKPIIRTAILVLFGEPLWTAALVGVGLAQIGEFSFILIQVARSAGHVGDDVYNATLAASLLTILGNAILVRWIPAWIRKADVGREGDAAAGRAMANRHTPSLRAAGRRFQDPRTLASSPGTAREEASHGGT